MGFRRKHDTAGCKQLDLGCTLAQLLARSLAHLIDAISNHRHDGEGADMTAWVDVFIRRAKIRTPARLCQGLARVKKSWTDYGPLGHESRNLVVSAPGLSNRREAVHEAIPQVARSSQGDFRDAE